MQTMRTTVLILLSAPALVTSLSPRTASASRECSCTCVKRPCPPCPCAAARRPRRNRTGSGNGTARSASAFAVEASSYRMDVRAGAGDVSPASLAEKWRRIADSCDRVDGALERKLAGSERDTSSLDEEEPSGRRRGRTRSLVAAGAILLASLAASILAFSASSSPIGEIISGAASTAWDRIVDLSRGGGGHATGPASSALLSIGSRLPFLRPGNDTGPRSALLFLRAKAIPTAIALLKKFAIMEAWRRVWVVVFRTAQRAWHSVTKRVGAAAAVPWKNYCPAWIRRGFKSLFVKAVQGSVDEAVGTWVGYVASTEYVAGWVAPSSSATDDVIESIGADNRLAEKLFEATVESNFLEAAAENVVDAVAESDMIATAAETAAEAAGETNMAESVFEAVGEAAADALGESGLSDATVEVVAAAALPA